MEGKKPAKRKPSSKSFLENQLEECKYVWEFLRRDPEFKRHLAEYKTLIDDGKLSQAEQKIRDFKDFDLGPCLNFLKPEKSFDELWSSSGELEKLLLFTHLMSKSVKIRIEDESGQAVNENLAGSTEIWGRYLVLKIDLATVNSIDGLKSLVSYVVGDSFSRYRKHDRMGVLKPSKVEELIELANL